MNEMHAKLPYWTGMNTGLGEDRKPASVASSQDSKVRASQFLCSGTAHPALHMLGERHPGKLLHVVCYMWWTNWDSSKSLLSHLGVQKYWPFPHCYICNRMFQLLAVWLAPEGQAETAD